MNNELIKKIKRIIASNPDSVIYYHEDNEWSIYSSGAEAAAERSDRYNNGELLEGNDYINTKEFAPELVIALADMLGIRVMSNSRARDISRHFIEPGRGQLHLITNKHAVTGGQPR